MAEISLLIGLIGLTIFVGYLASLFFDKTKIPDVLLLMLMGVILGPVTGILDGSIMIGLAGLVGTIALIIIVFDGSTKLNFFDVMDELPESVWFTIAVCFMTIIGVTLVFLYGAGWPFIDSVLVGVIVAGTSYEIIVPLIAKLTVKENAKTLLNLESALNDIVTIIGMIVIMKFIKLQEVKLLDPVQIFISTFSIAIFIGIVAGVFWLRVLKNYKGKQFEYLLTLAFVFFLYSVTEAMKGNGITSIIVFGLILGNSEALARLFKSKEEAGLDPAITNFNSEVSFFVRTMFFVYIGVVLDFQNVTMPIVLVAFLTFLAALAARFGAVELLVKANPSLKESQFIITSMLPRGLATAVLAALPATEGIGLNGIIEIVLIFMIFTNIFATAAAYYFETRIVPSAAAPAPQTNAKKPKS